MDIYFDDVGGEILDLALARLAFRARVVLLRRDRSMRRSGGNHPVSAEDDFDLLFQNARIEASSCSTTRRRFPQAIADMSKWLSKGRIIDRSIFAEGLENAPKTIVHLYTGATSASSSLKLGCPQWRSAGITQSR